MTQSYPTGHLPTSLAAAQADGPRPFWDKCQQELYSGACIPLTQLHIRVMSSHRPPYLTLHSRKLPSGLKTIRATNTSNISPPQAPVEGAIPSLRYSRKSAAYNILIASYHLHSQDVWSQPPPTRSTSAEFRSYPLHSFHALEGPLSSYRLAFTDCRRTFWINGTGVL
jgi:hypothetical protein